MKKLSGIIAFAALLMLTLNGCMGWTASTSVGGGTGWFAGDYAPYYWSNWNGAPNPPIVGNGPGSLIAPVRPTPPPPPPGNSPMPPGGNHRPPMPPASVNGPGSNPGSPAQGGYRGQN